MTIQSNPELQKVTVELSHEEAALVADALKGADEAAGEAGKVLHPVLAKLHAELHALAQKLGLVK